MVSMGCENQRGTLSDDGAHQMMRMKNVLVVTAFVCNGHRHYVTAYRQMMGLRCLLSFVGLLRQVGQVAGQARRGAGRPKQ